jgi:hypothetical protein
MWRLLAESARYNVFLDRKSVGVTVSKPPVQSRQVRQLYRACDVRCSRAADDERDVAGKLTPQCPNLSSAPGALRLDAAQRHGGNRNFSGKRSDLLDRSIDAEYQRSPLGEREHQCGHLESETM